MADNRKFLPVGTQLIETNGTRYKILRKIAGGGSSIIYEAEQVGNFRMFILKECYPSSTKYFFTRKGGSVCPVNSEDIEASNYLRSVKENMERENKIGQLIANRTGRTVAAWGKLNVDKVIIDEKIFDAAESLFIVMERVTDREKSRGIFLTDLLDECSKDSSDDAPLRNGGCPSPHVATNIVEQLLKSLRDVHAAGYIFKFFLDGS